MDIRMDAELHRVNERYVGMLVEMARHDAQPMFPLIDDVGSQLLGLDASARLRVAQRSYLLVDISSAFAEARQASWSSQFPRSAAVEIARRALTLAWHDSGTRLGLAHGVAERLARLTLEEVESIAESHVELMVPRWHDKPGLWRRLLKAAIAGDTQALHNIDLHNSQILAGDLLKHVE